MMKWKLDKEENLKKKCMCIGKNNSPHKRKYLFKVFYIFSIAQVT